MFRRFLAILAATAVAFAVLPAVMALAAPAGSATLTAGGDVFPGTNTFTVNVRNNESAGTLGFGRGSTINGLELLNPTGFSGVVCGSSGGFTCTVQGRNILLTGSTIAPGGQLAVTFNANVNKPFDRDRTQSIDVRVTDDNFTTTGSVGRVNVITRALRIVAGSLAPLNVDADDNVTDNTGTATQAIKYKFAIESLAQAPITVTPTLTSNGSEVIAPAGALTVPASGTSTATFDVTLGQQASGQRAVLFTADATGTDVNPAAVTNNAFQVQAKPTLALQANTFSPKFVRSDGTTYTFTVTGSKVNPPGLTGLQGTLKFAGTTATLASPTAIGASGVNGLSFSYQPTEVLGSDDLYDAVFAFSGLDDNGFDYSQELTLGDLITIDNIGPLVNTVLGLPNGQTQVKNGDVVTVNVTIDGGALSEELVVTATEENGGGELEFPTNCAIGATSCNTSITLSGLPAYGEVAATAVAADQALNIGIGPSNILDYDAVIPFVAPGPRIVNGDLFNSSEPFVIEVDVEDRHAVYGGCNENFWEIDDPDGGTISLLVVEEVLYSNGEPCNGSDTPTQPGNNPGDGIRVLIPSQQLVPQEVYNVAYLEENSLGQSNPDPLTDLAINEALEDIVSTVDGVKPDLPEINLVKRNTTDENGNLRPIGDEGRETAVFDADTYWTRFAGNDLRIETFANRLTGYAMEVLDENDVVLISDPDAEDVLVPIGTAEGTYTRGIRFVNSNGIKGDILTFTVTLDQTLPTISSAAKGAAGTDANDVTVTFGEPIWAGAPRPMDWFALETNQFAGQGDDPYHQNRGESVTGSQSNVRIIENVNFTNEGPFAGVDYAFNEFQAQQVDQNRLEDRAGNFLADQRVVN